MKRLLTLILITSFSIAGKAAEFLDGYIVMPNNDTVKCKFKIGGFVSHTNFYNKLTVITGQGEEQVFHARDKKILAYGFVDKGRKYDYLYVDVKPRTESGFYQRTIDGPRYKLYSIVLSSSTYPGISMQHPQYVLFNPAGEYEKFETCLACPWRKQLRKLLKDDPKALEALEKVSRLEISKFVMEINRD